MQSLGGAHCPVPVHFKYRGVRATAQLGVSKQHVVNDYSLRKVEVDEGRILSAIFRDHEIGILLYHRYHTVSMAICVSIYAAAGRYGSTCRHRNVRL